VVKIGLDFTEINIEDKDINYCPKLIKDVTFKKKKGWTIGSLSVFVPINCKKKKKNKLRNILLKEQKIKGWVFNPKNLK
jgi:hypothetical protein